MKNTKLILGILIILVYSNVFLMVVNRGHSALLLKVYESNEQIKQDNAAVLDTLKKYRLELGEVDP